MSSEVFNSFKPFDLDPTRLADKRITIMGLGRFGGGAGAARFFAQRSAKVTVTDLASVASLQDSLASLGDLGEITFHLGEHRNEDFTQADAVVVNPAVPWDSPFLRLARDAGVALTAEMNIFFRLCPARIVGITGSNGKSTTTAMIDSILKTACAKGQGPFEQVFLGGNIGRSLLAEVDRINPNDVVVLELSSFQLQALQAERISPHIAVWTNLTPNHLDRHGTLDAYRSAKQNIYRFQKPDDVLISNADDPALEFLKTDESILARQMSFSLSNKKADAFLADGHLNLRYPQKERTEKLLSVELMPAPGDHNVANGLAAACAGAALGLDPAAIGQGIREFKPLPHRLELVARINGVEYYDDSIATTPESALVGLNSFKKPPIIILGGKDKGANFDALLTACTEKSYGIVCMGQTRHSFLERLLKMRGSHSLPHLKKVQSLKEAVFTASAWAKPGHAVLLSPACASYDMFANFEDRGRKFAKLVQALA